MFTSDFFKQHFDARRKREIPFNRSLGQTLDDVYGSYSKAKQDAYSYCTRLWSDTWDEVRKHGFTCTGWRITSANTFVFTFEWDIVDSDGDLVAMARITRDHNWLYVPMQ